MWSPQATCRVPLESRASDTLLGTRKARTHMGSGLLHQPFKFFQGEQWFVPDFKLSVRVQKVTMLSFVGCRLCIAIHFFMEKILCCCSHNTLLLLNHSVPLFATPWTCGPPGSSIHGISQARILEWVAISSSRGSFPTRDQTQVPCSSCSGRQILYH